MRRGLLTRRYSVMLDKYKMIEGSSSAHCCFAFTVLNLTKPLEYQGSDDVIDYEIVCECFTEEDADLVCKALNSYLEPK